MKVARLQSFINQQTRKIEKLEYQLESTLDDKNSIQKKYDRSLITRTIVAPPSPVKIDAVMQVMIINDVEQ